MHLCKKCHRTDQNSEISRLLQQTFLGTKNHQSVETYVRPQFLEQNSEDREVQNGNIRYSKDLPSGSGVGNVHRLQVRLLSHTNSHTIQEVPALSFQWLILPIQSTTFWSVHSTCGIHGSGEGQTDGFTQRYKNPPVPR